MKLVKVLSAPAFAGALLLLFATSLSAGDKSAETGIIKDGIYHDTRFAFSVKIPTDWREAKLRKEPSAERILMVQRKPRVPLRLQDSPEAAVRPSVMIFTDSTTMTPAEFFAFIRADTGKTDFKQRILAKSVFLEQGVPNEIEVMEKMTTKILGRDATRMKVRLEYSARVENPGMSKKPVQVNDYRIGYIFLVPFDGWLMYIEEVCENQFLQSLQPDFDTVINSLAVDSTAGK
jgi:hypothetical protein